MSRTAPLPPNATIGILGGGQLGRMLASAAAQLGYRAVVLDPQPDCPAEQLANRHIVADYLDEQALATLADGCDVITYEFENVPAQAVRQLEARRPVRPGSKALETAQDRLVEKTFLNACGIETARFMTVDTPDEAEAALAAFPAGGVLKTRRLGYDGKGQAVLAPGDDAAAAFAQLGAPAIMEERIAFACEISIIAARGLDGEIACYEPARNEHREGILRKSRVPAGVAAETVAAAKLAAERLLDALDYVGAIGVEFFVLEDGGLLANEFAPRVHNSGHWTEAACSVSQFEQHIRAIAGLKLGPTGQHSDCIMENLIGDEIGRAARLLAEPDVVLTLYGKSEARAGRKMGHFTRLTPRRG